MEEYQILTAIALSLIFSIGPLSLVVICTFINYRKNNYRHLLFFLIGWICVFLWMICMTLAEVLLSIPIKIIGTYFLIAGTYALILNLEYISRDLISPMLLVIYTILATLLVIESLKSGAQTIGPRANGEISVISSGSFRLFYTLNNFFLGLVFLIYMTMILYNSPKSLKKYAILNFIGAILVGLITPLTYLGGMSVLLPGSTNFLMSLGIALTTIAFIQRPQLAFILPYKVFRLIILNVNNGVPLYNYSWESPGQNFEDYLFSGMLHAVSGILDVTISRGDVRSIELDQAILLINHLKEIPIACVLIASKSSQTLKLKLTEFSKQFIAQFGHLEFDMCDVVQLNPVSKLIAKNFSFVPDYNEK